MRTAEDWPIAAAMLSMGDASPADDGAGTSLRRWREDLIEVRGAGFDLVDLTDSWVPYGDLSPEQLRGLKECLSEAGLAAASMSAIRRSVTDPDAGADHLAYLHRCIDAAAELGASVISVGLHRALTDEQRNRLWFWTATGHVDDVDDPDAWSLAAARFRELGEHAGASGLLLSLELYEDTYLGTAASAVRLVEEIGLDAVGLNPDIGNLIRLSRPVEDWRDLIEQTAPYANFWHVKNYARYESPGDGIYAAVPAYLESGVIDYRACAKTMARAGFDGVVCVEHYGGDGLSMSAANRDYLRTRVLPAAGPVSAASRVRQPNPREGR
ncbi:sugar phosphate isomerase/epimerase family protein [Microbacterium insulae]|uniref:Sugar phosphate isomerase/epimerase family protein n=1 Tax=Microbacterium insulae TaxID=483014 RepID=A0ABW3AG27_9MICO